MELAVDDNPEQAQFEIRADGELAGFLQYHLHDGVIAFLHAETDPRFRGHGVAGRLIQSSLDSARERHLAVLPYCPFVRGWITEHLEYAALVPDDMRPVFGLLPASRPRCR
jgi:predicted GNAT family acetyltransferase